MMMYSILHLALVRSLPACGEGLGRRVSQAHRPHNIPIPNPYPQGGGERSGAR
jgi:hypothetical protein